MIDKTYKELKQEVLRLRNEGKIPNRPDRNQRADWAYGNTVIENPAITREMADRAVEKISKD